MVGGIGGISADVVKLEDSYGSSSVGADGGAGDGPEPGLRVTGRFGRARIVEAEGLRGRNEAIGVSGGDEPCGRADVAEGVAEGFVKRRVGGEDDIRLGPVRTGGGRTETGEHLREPRPHHIPRFILTPTQSRKRGNSESKKIDTKLYVYISKRDELKRKNPEFHLVV